ncbi:nicotianamine synthase-like [Impatiens glandulifera]|uniref:nicotianamine synthase-like n=1 Tax=Impatiens glandulifera TaxID=253017 RepID=UPI001FB19F8A|nr:nicotianamine synthase-like [Impatiens glandulifera]
MAEEELVIARVCDLYEKISKLDSLKPSNDVNMLFTHLVNMCIPSYPNLDISKLSDQVQQIRSNLIRLCGQAEGLLESHYSAILGSFQNPLNHLSLFPYFSNYLKLSQLEFTILTQHFNRVPTRVAFIGSGPLPLTSLVLATTHLTKTSFHNYDIDKSANDLAAKLVQSDPDMSSRMSFHTANILDVCGELEEFEVVFLAALVGMDMEEKVKVIDHLAKHMAPGATLMLRSAHGARAFLYPVVQPSDLRGFEVLSVFHPMDEVINSVVIARKFPDDHHDHDDVVVDDLQEQAAASSLATNLIVPNKCCCEQMRGTYNHLGQMKINNILEELAMEEHIA